MKRVLLVFNPKSGRGDFIKSLYSVISLFSRAGYEVAVYPTTSSGDAKDYVQKRGSHFDLVVCAGGDGMISEVVNAYMKMDAPPPLGYIPTGTTNDFAVSLGIPKVHTEAADAVLNGQARNIDIGRFGGQYFSYVAAFGKFTDVSYSTAQSAKNILGRAAYIFEGIKQLGNLDAVNCEIDIDGEIIAGDFILGVVTNMTTVAGFRVPADKDSSVDDGLFEAIFVRSPQSLAELPGTIAALTDPSAEADTVIRRTAKKINFTHKNPCGWTVDGEFGGEHSNITLENIRRALSIILPPQ